MARVAAASQGLPGTRKPEEGFEERGAPATGSDSQTDFPFVIHRHE
jgi:hypothetical protein